jgi:hypothetical protein
MDESTDSIVIRTTHMQLPKQSPPRPLKEKNKIRSTPAISAMFRTPSSSGVRFFSK